MNNNQLIKGFFEHMWKRDAVQGTQDPEWVKKLDKDISEYVESLSEDHVADTKSLHTQISELKQSCIIYHTEREELKEKLTEANAMASSWMDKYHQLLSNQP